MARWVALAKDRHGGLRFRPLSSYAFARDLSLVPVCLAELSRVVADYPLVFVRRPDNAYGVCALLGLEPGRNLFVDPSDGRWLADYVPAAVRAYPFRLAPGQTPNQWFVCVDEDSGALDSGPEGTPLFDASGEMSPFVRSVAAFLHQLAADEQRTAQACARLQAAGLIVGWPVTVKSPEGERTITDLFQVDEAALQALDAQAVVSLHQAGALALAYAQRFSAWHLLALGKLMGPQSPVKGSPSADWGPLVTPSGELDLSFL